MIGLGGTSSSPHTHAYSQPCARENARGITTCRNFFSNVFTIIMTSYTHKLVALPRAHPSNEDDGFL